MRAASRIRRHVRARARRWLYRHGRENTTRNCRKTGEQFEVPTTGCDPVSSAGKELQCKCYEEFGRQCERKRPEGPEEVLDPTDNCRDCVSSSVKQGFPKRSSV